VPPLTVIGGFIAADLLCDEEMLTAADLKGKWVLNGSYNFGYRLRAYIRVVQGQ
jgi:hypothetical protein